MTLSDVQGNSPISSIASDLVNVISLTVVQQLTWL